MQKDPHLLLVTSVEIFMNKASGQWQRSKLKMNMIGLRRITLKVLVFIIQHCAAQSSLRNDKIDKAFLILVGAILEM